MNTLVCGKHFIHQTRRLAMAAAVVIWLSANCGSAAAQAPPVAAPPSSPKPTDEQKKAAATRAQLLEQMTSQVESLKADLRKTGEQPGDKDSGLTQIQNQLDMLKTLQERISEMADSGALNEGMLPDFHALLKEVRTQPERVQLRQVQEQFAQQQKLLAERDKQMTALLTEQRRQPLPPLENGQLKVYSLVTVPARAAAQTIESLFGSQVLRIAIEERSNSLIVYGKADSLTAVDALLSRLDEQAAASARGEKTKQSAAAAPRSILLRVFWLADNLPESVGQNPFDFLPESVIRAAQKLGLERPRLVTQTVNSLALGREDAADFSSNVPALLFEQEVGLTCQGKVKLVSDDRVRLEMGVHVGGPTVNCEINGSLATPLGHYMVLGTANSVMAEGGAAGGQMAPGGAMMGPGMLPGAGPEGGGFGRGGAGRPVVGARGAPGFGGAVAGPGVGPGGEAGGPGTGEQRPKPTFNASRFAFVVQVIDGQSYPAETEKAPSNSLPPRPTK